VEPLDHANVFSFASPRVLSLPADLKRHVTVTSTPARNYIPQSSDITYINHRFSYVPVIRATEVTASGLPGSCNFAYSFVWLGSASVVQWSEFLATDPEVRDRFPALSDFLGSSGSGTGSTEPCEHN
jgi:hypothetical protein